MARQLNEKETKTVKLIERILADEMRAKPEVSGMLGDLQLKPYTVGDKSVQILVVSVKEDLLRFLRKNYREFLTAMKKEFPGMVILATRNEKAPEKKGLALNRKREALLNDLCFPAVVMGRSQEVESRTEVVQNVYLDAKQSYWSDNEMKAIQCLAAQILKDKFEFKLFATE
ncbi:hypothetical protein ECANGB1_2244 [Enterospora canceri]|uniref:Uncharacterized protein n=1 Tax=Enterospora canceri TaxID=1081671 RepID=A0A1Y1S5J7_9MICR|nr:hypothetical protein ECANGB1_2244 [Enterospora canceri]